MTASNACLAPAWAMLLTEVDMKAQLLVAGALLGMAVFSFAPVTVGYCRLMTDD